MPLHRSTHVLGAVGVASTAVLALVGLVLILASPKDRAALLDVTAQCSYRDGGALPDATCTPGAINHAVTQRTIHKTICVPGWTSTVRPPAAVTEPQKFASMRAYGDSTVAGQAGLYEYDHLIPLELGGATDDTRNLWPEPHHIANGEGSFTKDGIENRLRRAVCDGRMPLWKARQAIKSNWTTATIP